jgi:hypothetical protein
MRTTLLTICTLLAVMLTGCSGCSNERYVCDTTGCYRCDGIGCRAVDPPPPEDCVGDYQCEGSDRCTVDGCLEDCTTVDNCTDGTVCDPVTKLCAAPDEPPVLLPGVCQRDTDCPSPPAALCVNGLCVLDEVDCGSTACECTENSTCDSGYVCADGRCTPEDQTCHFNSECGAGHVCVDGLCYEGCGNAVTCDAGFTCVDGACEANPLPTGECMSQGECQAMEICLDSSCVPGCTVDANCATGFYCSNGACQPDTRPHPFCTSDANCLAGRSCVEGVCRTPCNTDTQCQMVSGTVPFCRNAFCVTNNEANSDCVTTVDCAGSNIMCVDGVCQ